MQLTISALINATHEMQTVIDRLFSLLSQYMSADELERAGLMEQLRKAARDADEADGGVG